MIGEFVVVCSNGYKREIKDHEIQKACFLVWSLEWSQGLGFYHWLDDECTCHRGFC
jgi:hypothetical protein